MLKWTKKVLLAALCLLAAFGLFSLTQYTMVISSNAHFCPTCHEIRFAFDTWKTSTHVNNDEGLVAECMDCHLPPIENTVSFYYMKAYHGIKDVFIHLTQEVYDRENSRRIVYETTKNGHCQKCHKNLLHTPKKRGAMLAHRSVIYARPGYEKNCLDCHRNLVHKSSGLYQFKQCETS